MNHTGVPDVILGAVKHELGLAADLLSHSVWLCYLEALSDLIHSHPETTKPRHQAANATRYDSSLASPPTSFYSLTYS